MQKCRVECRHTIHSQTGAEHRFAPCASLSGPWPSSCQVMSPTPSFDFFPSELHAPFIPSCLLPVKSVGLCYQAKLMLKQPGGLSHFFHISLLARLEHVQCSCSPQIECLAQGKDRHRTMQESPLQPLGIGKSRAPHMAAGGWEAHARYNGLLPSQHAPKNDCSERSVCVIQEFISLVQAARQSNARRAHACPSPK